MPCYTCEAEATTREHVPPRAFFPQGFRTNLWTVPEPLQVAVNRRIGERNKRAGTNLSFEGDICELLDRLTEPLRHRVEAKYLARRRPFEKAKTPGVDESTIDEALMREFDLKWKDTTLRLLLVPGKEVISILNTYLQSLYGITITPSLIVDSFTPEQVSPEMKSLIDGLNEFRTQQADPEKLD